MAPLITLLTDFGASDSYVASMKGVILGIDPDARIVDMSHDIPPQDVLACAFVLSTAYRHFPKGAIHVLVVDPGVGTRRRGIVLQTSDATFVAPDNGLLSYVLEDLAPSGVAPSMTPFTLRRKPVPAGVRAFALRDPRYRLSAVSATFHGRDVFAPAAAHLSRGVPAERLGPRVASLWSYRLPRPQRRRDGSLVGHVLHIDRFGNAITNVTSKDLPRGAVRVQVKGRVIRGLSRAYAASPSHGKGTKEGKVLALVGSSDYLEIAVRNGNAAACLDLKRGDEVLITLGTSTPDT